MDEQTLSLIPASEEDLQYLNPEPQPINLVPASQEDLQYITPVLQQPTMLDMTADFETFKEFRKVGAFDSQKSIGESIVESGAGMLSDFWQSAKTLPVRFASSFLFLDKVNDIYKPLGKVRTQAKATSLQTYGNIELDYKQLTSAIVRGVQKPLLEDESEEDLRSSYEFFRTQAELEHQRQGKAAEMVTEGFLGMSPEFLTLGMPEEEREQIRTQQVMPDMAAARGATMTGDPIGLLPLGSAFRLATGTGRQVLRGAEKALLNETMDLAKLQVNMKQALNRIGDNTVKSRRLAIKQAPARARLEKGLAEVTEKIAENKAKLKPLAAKRDMALTDIATKLPANHPLKEFLNESLKDVPVKQPLNLLNKAGGATLIGLAKPVEFLGNALQFIKTLPQETAINMLMKAGEKAGVEVTEQQANLLIKSGVVGGVGYGGYQFSEQFTDSEVGKLGGALSFLLGPQFLSRFGRNTAILGREIMKPTSDMAFFSRLASKDAEKLTTQLIDRTAILPVSSVARKVTGAAEGKVMSRMAGKEAFGNMSQGGQAAVNFLDRTGLGRYVETAGRLAKGAGVGGAVGGAFGLAASGGGDMPEAIYGGIGAGMLFGSAGALGAEVGGFSSPINHMEARYGDWMHYTENYLPANQKDAFNKLNRDVQMAVSNKIVANPSLSIEYVSNGKNAEGGYFDRVTGDIVINTDSPRAIEPLLAHEFTHYLEQTGGKRKFIDLLIGNPITGKPGIFVQRVTKQNQSKYTDLKVGDPIMVGEGANRKFLLSDEFEQARTEYGNKLQDTLLDSEGNKMSDTDLAKIMTDEQTVSEIVAEHGTDFLLNDPKRYRDKRRGTIGKIMGGILDTELVQNIPLLRQTIAMMGGTFRPDGRLITDNKLFSNLKKYPQITELVRKYNREIEGMSPQRKESLEQKGDIQGRDIKSSGRTTKEVVVDIKSTELAKSPQLAELLRAGTLLQIDKDGNVIPNLAMTAREQGKYNRSFAEKLKEAVEEKEKNEGLPEGHVRPEVNPKTGNIRFVGRYLDDSVIDKLEKSGNWNKDQIQTLRDVNSNIRNKGGNEYLMTYFKAAGQGGGRYVNAKVENHIEVPYGFEITQKNNIILRTVSVNQLVKNIDQLARQQQGELTRLYGADIAQAKVKLLQDLDQYHRNHADGLPGRTGLDANQDIAKSKADFINSAFGTGSKDQADSNPWRQSLGKKNPRDVYRSRRIERIGKMEQLSGTRFIDYDKINKAFIPKAEADVTVTEKLFMPASEAGAGKGKQAEAAKLWNEKGTDSPYFKKYSGGAKVVKIGEQHDFVSGEPVVVEGVHGSTHTFKEFDPSKGNPESDLGKAVYISNTPDEVGVNYAGEGPDLTGRIERKAETYMGMIEDELSSYGLSDDATQQQIEAKGYELARNELVGSGDQTYKVFAKFKNPVVVGEKFRSIDDFGNKGGKKETNFEMMFDEDAGTESGTLVDLLEQVDEVAYDFEFVDVDKVKSDIMEAADYDSIGAQELIKTMKESEGLMDTMDADGELANGEFVRQVFEGMGFDGIIDLSVNEKFGSQRKMGQSMEGMNPDTIHYLAFKPEQIKSATGNRGTFDAGERNILFMPSLGDTTPASVQSWDGPNPTFGTNFTRGMAKDNKEAAALLRRSYEDEFGQPIKAQDFTDEQVNWLGDTLAKEGEAALGRTGNAVNWYTSAVEKALSVAEEIFPDIGQKFEAKDRFLGALSITSQNMRVMDNAKGAVKQYQHKERTGKFDYSIKHGAKADAITSNLKLYDKVEAKMGVDKLHDFLDADFTVKELIEWGKNFFGDKKFSIAGYSTDKVKGSAIFGPKIGQGFFQNLRGNYDPVTVDLWLRRTYGRLTGLSLDTALTAKDVGRLIYAVRNNKGKRKFADLEMPDFLKGISISGKVQKNGVANYKISDKAFETLLGDHTTGRNNYDAVYKFAEKLNREWERNFAKANNDVTKAKDAVKKAKKDKRGTANLEKQLAKFEAEKVAIGKEKPQWAKAGSTVSDKLKPIDIPSNAERAVITKAFNVALKALKDKGINLTPADLQATLWYPEKDIWAYLKGENSDALNMSYDTAMEVIRDQR
jgi:hypothetical protein